MTPYSKLVFRVYDHSTFKKDALLGDCSLDLYSVLKKNGGRCQNQELALDLTCSDHKNGHSADTVGSLNVRLDGLCVDLSSLPAASPPVLSVLQASPGSPPEAASPLPGSSRAHTAMDGEGMPRYSLEQPRSSHSAPDRPPAPKLASINGRRPSSTPGMAPLPPPESGVLPPLAIPHSPVTPPGGEPGEGGLPKRITLPPISENTRQSLAVANGAAGSSPTAAAPPAQGATEEEPLPPGWEMRYAAQQTLVTAHAVQCTK